MNKANQKLGQIKHVFRFMDEKMMKLLFVSLVRPHLEYASIPSGIHTGNMIRTNWRRSNKEQQELKV